MSKILQVQNFPKGKCREKCILYKATLTSDGSAMHHLVAAKRSANPILQPQQTFYQKWSANIIALPDIKHLGRSSK